MLGRRRRRRAHDVLRVYLNWQPHLLCVVMLTCGFGCSSTKHSFATFSVDLDLYRSELLVFMYGPILTNVK